MQTQSLAQQMSNVEAIPLAWWIHYSQKLPSANVKLDLRKPRMENVSVSLFLFCSWVISEAYLTCFTVVAGIHEAAFAFLPTPLSNRDSETRPSGFFPFIQ